jgi:hypothetical protein
LVCVCGLSGNFWLAVVGNEPLATHYTAGRATINQSTHGRRRRKKKKNNNNSGGSKKRRTQPQRETDPTLTKPIQVSHPSTHPSAHVRHTRAHARVPACLPPRPLSLSLFASSLLYHTALSPLLPLPPRSPRPRASQRDESSGPPPSLLVKDTGE